MSQWIELPLAVTGVVAVVSVLALFVILPVCKANDAAEPEQVKIRRLQADNARLRTRLKVAVDDRDLARDEAEASASAVTHLARQLAVATGHPSARRAAPFGVDLIGSDN